jgi:ABC-type Fe3+-hydroxamate transport system substrate-binding protein
MGTKLAVMILRRDVIKKGGAVIGAGLLAGCASNPDSTNGTQNDSSDGSSQTGATTGGDSYSVTMSPAGRVAFDSVPEDVFVIFPQYADMAVALGHGDSINSLFVPEMSGKTMNIYYDRLDGISFEWKGLPDPLQEGLSKELLYSLDSDVHFADPAYVSTQKNWDQSDIREMRTNIGPWFGNFYSGTHDSPPKEYQKRYQYYSLWEIFGKIAQVFRKQKRYRALKKIHTDMVSTIQEDLPPKEKRPSAVRVSLGNDVFYTYHLNKPGYWMADTRPLGANDAFAEKNWSDLWGTVGYEAMIEADPDVILHLWGITPQYNLDSIRKQIKNHPVGKQLSAVQNDRLFPSGMRYQGPIMNLFQLEMTAKQLYPDLFGEWPAYTSGKPYPEIPEDERLFDRRRVSDIVHGRT